MALLEAVLIGGPLDGAKIGPKKRGGWVWAVAGTGKFNALGYDEPGPERLLYRATGVLDGVEVFLYAGHTHTRCQACDGYTAIVQQSVVFDWKAMRAVASEPPKCQGCGAELRAPSAQ